MAWERREIKDQIVEFPNRFKIDGESHIIEPDFGTVVEPGTPINRAYLQPIEDYLAQVETKDEVQTRINALAGEGNTKTVKQLDEELNSHKNDNTPHREAATLHRKNKDENGIYTCLEWYRADGTLFKTSELEGESPQYATRRVRFYAEDGQTLVQEIVYILTYDENGELISEVIQA